MTKPNVELSQQELDAKKVYAKQYYADNKDRIRENWLSRRYNITPAMFDEMMVAQNGSCAVCSAVFEETKAKKPHIDHDHSCCPGRDSCGKCIRGLLCYKCNVGLGSFDDDVERFRLAISYLDQGATIL